MRRLLHVAIILAVALVVAGCSNDSGVLNSDSQVDPALTASLTSFTLPEDATFESATFHILVDLESGQQVDVHRITDSWEEMVVTWNNFSAAFDGEVEASFVAGPGWQMTDVTGLVGSWLTGETQNHGLLLNQSIEEFPRTLYYDRESGQGSFLVIAYNHKGGVAYDTVVAAADAYIYEGDPDVNFGNYYGVWTGRYAAGEPNKQALIRFDLGITPPPGGEGCTRTIGYWKNHTGCRRHDDMVSQYLPLWLGDPNGMRSVRVNGRFHARLILSQRVGHPRNGITKLRAQLLAAKLNIAAGADDSEIADVVSQADSFLADHWILSWHKLSRPAKKQVLAWKDQLDAYNNGEIGPDHCDD